MTAVSEPLAAAVLMLVEQQSAGQLASVSSPSQVPSPQPGACPPAAAAPPLPDVVVPPPAPAALVLVVELEAPVAVLETELSSEHAVARVSPPHEAAKTSAARLGIAGRRYRSRTSVEGEMKLGSSCRMAPQGMAAIESLTTMVAEESSYAGTPSGIMVFASCPEAR